VLDVPYVCCVVSNFFYFNVKYVMHDFEKNTIN
jgi:hypothetical protein